MKEVFNVVVVGGGVAGFYTAYNVAKAGYSVAIIEMKNEEQIGEKVCGDAVGEHHFKEVGLEPPRVGVDATGVIDGVRVFSPSREHFVTAWGKGYALDRKAFGRRLLKMALDSGVVVFSRRSVIKPIVEGSWVKGVITSGNGEELRAKVVVDATGAAASLRTKLPAEWWVSYKAPLDDFNAAYRVIATVEEDQDTRFADIYLDVNVAPGGYWWWFPKGKRAVNVGLGVKAGSGSPNPRHMFERHIAPLLEKASGKIQHAGGGLVPTRRPVPCAVWNGFIAVGDAAYTANPLHGGGIGPALVSSYHAASQIVKALESGEASMERLWAYQTAYLKAYGIKQALLDVARIYLQGLSNDDIELIIKSGVVADEELSAIGYRGELLTSVLSKAASVVRILKRPSLLAELVRLKGYLDEAARHYAAFPKTPEGFERWSTDVERFYHALKERYWRRPSE
ncbi:MAG: NAD(P)/FAD-dependent oxidoreductase [Thermofilaceae archaeon]|nr:NAD(P)/FAD-dependent oxidoreductase [Thermofilaceae archaeon]